MVTILDIVTLLIIANITLTVIAIVSILRAGGKKKSIALYDEVRNRLETSERVILENMKILRSSISNLIESNISLLNTIREQLGKFEQVNRELNKTVLELKSQPLTFAPSNVDLVKRELTTLAEIDCVFSDEGLIMYGKYDQKTIAFITQALRVLENVNCDEIKIGSKDKSIYIFKLGELEGKKIYCLKESNTPVKINSKRILEELIGEEGV